MNGTCCCVELTVTEDAEVLLSVAEDSQVGLDIEEQFVTGGGITPSGTKEISVTQNGTTNTDVTYYANAKVIANVPNTYAAADEGKVVQDGDLEAQTTATFEANDVYDTTTIKQVTVDVPASAVDSGYVYIDENDTHDVTGYAQAVVNVPASAVDTGTKNITANGNNQDVVGYAAVNVNVPNTYAAGDEGKVVDNGALVSQGSATYTINNTYDTTKIKSVTVNVSGGGSPTLQTKSVSYTPSESQQTAQVTADEGYDALQEVDVTVGAVSSTYVGSDITRRDDTDLSASGATVSVPSGYYEDSETYTVSSGSATTPATSITANPSISVNSSTGVITATASATKSVTPTVSAGYVSSGTAGTITVSGSNTSALSTQSGTTITPTTSEQTAVAAGKYTLGAVKVAAMPSGTAGTPTATKGTVSNHSVSVTPSVTNSAGYIASETKTGTAVTVSASELDSGTKNISANGNNQDVVGYAAVNVAVPNSYSASDEGKVVSSGALVSQGSDTVTTNDTYDTTLINSLTVNVSGGGGGDDYTDFSDGNIQAIIGHGTEYIITDYTGPLNALFAFKFMDDHAINYEGFFSAALNNTRLGLQRYQSGNGINVYLNGSYVNNFGFPSYTSSPITIAISTIGTTSTNANKPLAIGRNYYNGNMESTIADFTFYGLNILDEHGSYTHRFLPWLENGVACVKDVISGTIYYNSGTGAYGYIDWEGVTHNA